MKGVGRAPNPAVKVAAANDLALLKAVGRFAPLCWIRASH